MLGGENEFSLQPAEMRVTTQHWVQHVVENLQRSIGLGQMMEGLGEDEFTIGSSSSYSDSILFARKLSNIKFSFSKYIRYFYLLGNVTLILNVITPNGGLPIILFCVQDSYGIK